MHFQAFPASVLPAPLIAELPLLARNASYGKIKDGSGSTPTETSKMLNLQHRRGWLLIALVAIGVALVMLMVPPTHGPGHTPLMAILPLLFVGIISPLSLLSPLAFRCGNWTRASWLDTPLPAAHSVRHRSTAAPG
jgi:hypothetical protein